MAMTIDDLELCLIEAFRKLNYELNIKENCIVLDLETRNHVNYESGLKVLHFNIKLSPDGKHFQCFCLKAFNAHYGYTDIFLQACSMIQWGGKLIHFEYNPSDGEVRPIVKIPLEDNVISPLQFKKIVLDLHKTIDTHSLFLFKALNNGEIDLNPFEKDFNDKPVICKDDIENLAKILNMDIEVINKKIKNMAI